MARPEKEAVVSELADKFSTYDNVYLADFTGLNVADTTELRRLLREADVEYRVVKNTLALRAVAKAGIEADVAPFFIGPTALAFGHSDTVAAARVLSEFSKKHPKQLPAIKGGLVAGKVVFPEDEQRIAKLPTREQLLGQLAGALSAPVSGFAGTLQAVIRSFATVLTQLKDQKDEN
jgi:large subunit ribosomal protein L10